MPKITCNITGSQYYITTEKIEERSNAAGKSAEDFLKSYVCKKAEMLVRKGYTIADIRLMLSVPVSTAPELTQEQEEIIMSEYSQTNVRRVLANYEAVSTLAVDESDADVAEYIDALKT